MLAFPAMSIETRYIVAGAFTAVLAVAITLSLPAAQAPRAQAQGVAWQELSIADALARAEAADTRVFVKFDAEWCTYCEQLDREVLSTPLGAALTEGMVSVSYDFDAEENRPLVERYVVLGLPTTLVLTPDGTQVGRIMGYHDAQQWTAEFRAAKTADDPVPVLREAYEAASDDPVATLRLGEALLVRGAPAEGEALLERVTWMDGEEAYEAGAEALFTLGRYYHRVRRDHRTSRHIWRELGSRYPDSAWAGGAWWWYGKAQAELGRHDLGLFALRQRADRDRDDVTKVSQWARYVATHELRDERDEAAEALANVSSSATDEQRADLEELREQLSSL